MKQSPASAVKLRSFVTLNRAARLKQHMGRSGYHSVATADPDLDWWVLLCYWLVKPMTGLRPEIIYTFWSRITASASLSRWITLMKAMKDIFRRVSANKTSYSDQKFYSWNVPLCLSRPKRVFQAKALTFIYPNQVFFVPEPNQKIQAEKKLPTFILGLQQQHETMLFFFISTCDSCLTSLSSWLFSDCQIHNPTHPMGPILKLIQWHINWILGAN